MTRNISNICLHLKFSKDFLQNIPQKRPGDDVLLNRFWAACIYFVFKCRPYSFAFLPRVVMYVCIFGLCFAVLLFQAESLRTSLLINFSVALCVDFIFMWTPFGLSSSPRESAAYVWFALSTEIRQWTSCFAVYFQTPARSFFQKNIILK